MTLTQSTYNDHPLFVLEGRLDTSNYRELESQFQELLKTAPKVVYVDMTSLEYIASSGLRVFLAVEKVLRADQGHLVLVGMTEFVNSVFEISGLLQVFHIQKSL